MEKILWIIYVEQPRGIYDGGQFKSSRLYKELRIWQILQELEVIVQSMRMIPYFIGDYVYPICIYLQKN